MQPHDEVHVLDDALQSVAADRQQVFLAEQPERAGDHEAAAEPVPAEPAEQEGPEILDHLNAGEEASRHARIGDAAVLDGAAVGDAHRAADRRDAAPEQERARQPQQGVGLDERVGIDGDD